MNGDRERHTMTVTDRQTDIFGRLQIDRQRQTDRIRDNFFMK